MNIALKLPKGGVAALGGGGAAKVGASDRGAAAANTSANDEAAKLLDEGETDDKAGTPLHGSHARAGRAAS